MNRLYPLLVLLCCALVASAQSSSVFSVVDERSELDDSLVAERVLSPERYLTLALNQPELQRVLKTAPMEGNERATGKSEVLAMPLSDGSVERFHVLEYSMLEPALAAQFPEIKTYHGYGVDDPTKRIRIDWTADGFNAMLLLPDGMQYVRPYAAGTRAYYLSYAEHDVPVDTEPFSCQIIDDLPGPIRSDETSSRAGDCQLRQYRLAVAVTGEYATQTLTASSAGTAADDAIVTAHIVTSVNQINGWYERDVTVRFVLVANLANVFYYNGATDPYSNGPNDSSIDLLNENTANLNAVLGSTGYDVGHILGRSSGGSGGVARLRSVCRTTKGDGVTRASRNGIAQPRFLKVWAHELGHQYGAGHTQNENCQRSSASAMEPGAGTTIMSYVTSACNNQIQNFPEYYFHAISISQMSAHLLNTSCAAILPSTNAAPTVSAGLDHTVPSATPLLLSATASDPNNDPLTYTWEQFDNDAADAIPPQASNQFGPNFRSLFPSTSSERYLPSLNSVVSGASPTWEVLPSVARTMDFIVTVRDNSTNSIGCTDEDQMSVTTTAAGPFEVLSPTNTGIVWFEGQTRTVTWTVAGTNLAPVSCSNVDILLSRDGGFTYSPIVFGVPNTGSASLVVPTGVTTAARIMVRCSDNIFYNISASNFEIRQAAQQSFTLEPTTVASTICPGESVLVDLNTTTVAGFVGTLSLSVTGLPAGATASFQNAQLPAGSSTRLTIGNTGGVPQGVYPISIIGTSGTLVRTASYELTVEEGAGVSTLSLPLDGANDVYPTATFTWVEKANASAYQLQVATVPSFGSPIVDESLTETNFSVSTPLLNATTYYWRVKATTSCGDTPWSPMRLFQTASCLTVTETTPVFISNGPANTVTSPLVVTFGGSLESIAVRNVTGTHTFMSDLTVNLIAPGGSPTVVLWDRECGSSNDFSVSLSDDAFFDAADAPCAPFGQGRIFKPESPLAAFAGIPRAGTWTLEIVDNFGDDGGVLTSWTLDFCSSFAPLPVELLAFGAEARAEDIALSWRTASEIDNAGFEVERRADAEAEFRTLFSVAPAADQEGIREYSAIDEAAEPGVRYYYRLRQIDLDGQDTYSEVRTAMIRGLAGGLSVRPNPVRNELYGQLSGPASERTELTLVDVHGRLLRREVVEGGSFQWSMQELPAGLYLLTAKSSSGDQTVRVVVD